VAAGKREGDAVTLVKSTLDATHVVMRAGLQRL
jgi:hypothetical protein